jgi:hypothetical protein
MVFGFSGKENFGKLTKKIEKSQKCGIEKIGK